MILPISVSMKAWKNLITFYRKTPVNWFAGIGLALIAASSGALLTVVSGWFIAATALAGMDILSLQTYNLFLPGAVIRLFAFTRPVSKYFERLYNHQLTFRLIDISRYQVFEKLGKSKKSSLTDFRGTDLATRMTADIDSLDNFYLSFLVPWLTSTVLYFSALVYLFATVANTGWLMSFIYLLSGVIIPSLVFKFSYQDEKRTGMLNIVKAEMTDFADAHREFKSFGKFAFRSNQIRSKIAALAAESIRRDKIKIRFSALQSVILQLGIVLAILLLLKNNAVPHQGPAIVFTIFLIIVLLDLLQTMPENFSNLAAIVIAAERVYQLDPDAGHPAHPVQPIKVSEQIAICLCNLSFDYGRRYIFKKVNVCFEKGKTHVIYGNNGTGKSTLFDLIAGLLQPEQGDIAIDGLPLTSFTEEFRAHTIAYMEQHLSLFDCSIHDNITLGSQNFTLQDVEQAAYLAGLGNLIESLDKGLHTVVNENHSNISGGQARMICLARLILRNSPIILLDEPTSGLDAGASERFAKLINSWSGQKTILLITHSEISGLRSDKDYRIAEGQIIALNR